MLSYFWNSSDKLCQVLLFWNQTYEGKNKEKPTYILQNLLRAQKSSVYKLIRAI